MKKLFSMFVLMFVALIALHQPCVLAQDVAVAETISTILNDVEAEPVAVVAMQPIIVVAAEPATVEEISSAAATAETVNQDAVTPAVVEAADPVNVEVAVLAVLDPVGGVAPAETEVATPVTDETDKSEPRIQVINNGFEPSSPDADGAVRVSIDFEQSPLPDVVRAFRDASGANIISGWTNTTPHLVSVRLNNVEWRVGLSAIVASYGLELKEDSSSLSGGSPIYIIREKPY